MKYASLDLKKKKNLSYSACSLKKKKKNNTGRTQAESLFNDKYTGLEIQSTMPLSIILTIPLKKKY